MLGKICDPCSDRSDGELREPVTEEEVRCQRLGGPEEVISRSAGRSKPQQCLLGWPTAGAVNLGKFYLKTDGMQLLTVICVSVLLIFFFKIALKNNILLL